MDSREVEQRLQQWVRPSTQPAYLRGGIDHPVVDDVAAAADSLATERQAREAAEARAERLAEALQMAQRALATMTEPRQPESTMGAAIVNAYAQCKEAEAKARAALQSEEK